MEYRDFAFIVVVVVGIRYYLNSFFIIYFYLVFSIRIGIKIGYGRDIIII